MLSPLSSALSDSNSNNAAPDNRTQSILQETGSSDAAWVYYEAMFTEAVS